MKKLVYVRKNNLIVGAVAMVDGNCVGWSYCSQTNVDRLYNRWSKRLAREIAWGRAKTFGIKHPKPVETYYQPSMSVREMLRTVQDSPSCPDGLRKAIAQQLRL